MEGPGRKSEVNSNIKRKTTCITSSCWRHLCTHVTMFGSCIYFTTPPDLGLATRKQRSTPLQQVWGAVLFRVHHSAEFGLAMGYIDATGAEHCFFIATVGVSRSLRERLAPQLVHPSCLPDRDPASWWRRDFVCWGSVQGFFPRSQGTGHPHCLRQAWYWRWPSIEVCFSSWRVVACGLSRPFPWPRLVQMQAQSGWIQGTRLWEQAIHEGTFKSWFSEVLISKAVLCPPCKVWVGSSIADRRDNTMNWKCIPTRLAY